MLLEREEELGLLADLLVGLDSSGGRVVLIRGEAGIGKSSLVREFVGRHADEAHVHVGSCDDLSTPRPLGPFWDIARQEPSLAELLGQGDRPAVLEATLDLLSRSLRPTVLVIEDTQWADEATLDAIRYVGRRISKARGLLVLTYRDGAVDYDHPLRGVIGDLPPERVVRIQLGGLSLSAVKSIIGGAHIDPSETLAATHGNPFLVTELVAAGGDLVPSSVQDSVMARVRKLSNKARAILNLLSVMPERIDREDLPLLDDAAEELAECERRGLIDVDSQSIEFKHELIRRAIEASLTSSERVAMNRRVLDALPLETDPARLVHHAREANDVPRLVDLAPRAARAAAAVESHREALDHYRQLEGHIDKLELDLKGPVLGEWAREELFLDNVAEAMRVGDLALAHYRELGDASGISGALASAAHYAENAGQRDLAEELARESVEVLGSDPGGPDLARALEVNAYLQMMAGNVGAVPKLVERTLAAGGTDIDERILIRSLNHMGIVMNIANYPEGRTNLDEAWRRAQASGQWYEESRALFNHAWAAVEFRDLQTASDYLERAIASAERHQLAALSAYGEALLVRVLELEGQWASAEDLATSLLGSWALSQMVVLPVLGVIAARKGSDTAEVTLRQAWEKAVISGENQRKAPAAVALAEWAWISDGTHIPVSEFKRVMDEELAKGFKWSPGAIAFWLWKLNELAEAPDGVAAPYRLVINGEAEAAAAIWEAKGLPYEQAVALMHGDESARLRALGILDKLTAVAVAGKLRKSMREQGLSVPRGKGRKTREHTAGLTARQAEILELLDQGLTNIQIADRLFLSPRTVEHHVSGILTKLDATTREEAVSQARSEGLLATKTA